MQLKSVEVLALQMPSRKSCEKQEVAKVDMLHNSQQAIEKPGFWTARRDRTKKNNVTWNNPSPASDRNQTQKTLFLGKLLLLRWYIDVETWFLAGVSKTHWNYELEQLKC